MATTKFGSRADGDKELVGGHKELAASKSLAAVFLLADSQFVVSSNLTHILVELHRNLVLPS